MTVAELIKDLQAHPQDAIVILARDAEGNSFDPLACVDGAMYEDREIGLVELTDALRAEGYSEEDLRPDGERATVLWPR